MFYNIKSNWGSNFAMLCNFPNQHEDRDSLFNILLHQFALGNITHDEYKEKKKMIENELA